MFISQNRLHRFVQTAGRGALLAAFAAAATLALNAQQNEGGEGAKGTFYVQPVSTATLLAANDTSDSVGYSTSAGVPETDAAVNFLAPTGASPAMQPPPRRYGRRPVYADSSHNADGSNKYTFFAGAGFTLPTGGTHAYFSPSYDFQLGGGRNFNKKLALLLEFDWSNFGLQKNATAPLESTAIYGVEVDGHAHDWSFTLDPMYTFAQTESLGAYVIGGVGYYHKYTDLTTPGVGEYQDPYTGYIYQYSADEDLTYGQYTSNALGVNGGFGVTLKPSRFGNERFYVEARYVYTANQAKPYYDGTGTSPSSNPNYINIFPQNSAKTTYIPITFGVRF